MVSVWNILDRSGLDLTGHYLPNPEAIVRWTAASELVDPSPFLEGGELLLTTGGNTSGWSTQWRDYVLRLRQAGVVAIGLGTGLTYDTVPHGLLAACQRHAMNLIEVPTQTTFVSVTQHTARMLFQGEQAQVHGTLMVQRDLALTALNRDDPSELLHTLSEMIGGGAGLLSPNGVFVAGPYGIELHQELATFAERVVQLRPRGLRAAASSSSPDGSSLIQPIGLSGRPEQYLAVWFAGPFSNLQRGAVSTAATLLSLAAERQRDRRETNRRLSSRATELLLEGDIHTAVILLATANGVDPTDVALPPSGQVMAIAGSDDDLTEAQEALVNFALTQGSPILIARQDRLHLALSTSDIDPVYHMLSNLTQLEVRLGIGSQQPPDRLHQSRVHADYALAQATEFNPATRWDDLMDVGAVALMNEGVAHEFSRSFLLPLRDRPDLLETLRAFLLHHGSRGKTAEELGVHRNTVRHRIAEVETLLNRNLDDEHVRVNAWIALQVDATHRLLGDFSQ